MFQVKKVFRFLFILCLSVIIYDEISPRIKKISYLTTFKPILSKNQTFKCTYVRCAVAVVLDLSDAQLTSQTSRKILYHKSGCPEEPHHFLAAIESYDSEHVNIEKSKVQYRNNLIKS